MQYSDTSLEIARMQAEIYRRMTGEQRLKIAFEMCDFARELAMTRIRMDHPDWTERQVRLELLRLTMLPDELPAALQNGH